MEVTSKEQKRAEQLLQSQHIGLHQIKSFSFMKRYHPGSFFAKQLGCERKNMVRAY